MGPGCSPLKRAAASAALLNMKLEVRNIASECSLDWRRTVPALTASVSMSYSSLSMSSDPKNKKPRTASAVRGFPGDALAEFIKRPQADIQIGARNNLRPAPDVVNRCSSPG